MKAITKNTTANGTISATFCRRTLFFCISMASCWLLRAFVKFDVRFLQVANFVQDCEDLFIGHAHILGQRRKVQTLPIITKPRALCACVLQFLPYT